MTRDQIKELFLHELSHAERLLAILWYVERMTPDEIALAIDSTPTLVKVSHSRILQKLG
jgi:DNA-directed RNA polymerase specialized sigma24 family protein